MPATTRKAMARPCPAKFANNTNGTIESFSLSIGGNHKPAQQMFDHCAGDSFSLSQRGFGQRLVVLSFQNFGCRPDGRMPNGAHDRT